MSILVPLPLVSVVIPAYNCERYLARAVASVLGQSYPHLECIVVDDGSTDGTAAVIASHGDKIQAIRQANAGAAAARNTGVAAARGEYVAFLDSDDYWLDTKIANQMNVFRDHPDVVLVCCGFSWDSADVPPMTEVVHGPHYDADKVHVFRDLTQLLRDPYLGTPSVVVHAHALKEIGGFEASLPIAEDVDLYFRLCARRPYAILNQELVRFQRRPGSLTSQIRGYEDNLRVYERLEQALPELAPRHRELLRTQRLDVFARWISDLLVRGQGRAARRVLRESQRFGRVPRYRFFYLKSLVAPVMPRLRGIRQILAAHGERGCSM